MMPDCRPEAFHEVPPSAKLIYVVLEHEGTLTQKQLHEETMLPNRTARFALERLTAAGLVETSLALPDARQKLYSLPCRQCE